MGGLTGLGRVRVRVGQGWIGLNRVGQGWEGVGRGEQGLGSGVGRVGQGASFLELPLVQLDGKIDFVLFQVFDVTVGVGDGP